MRWAVTGTPGTGKTTATRHLDVGFPILHINELIEEGCFQAGYDEGRGSTIADIDQLRSWLRKQPREIVVESHLSHLLPVDHVVVLRCHPETLRDRLTYRRDDTMAPEKIDENVESERLDLILAESVSEHGADATYEIDTTNRTPQEVARIIEDAINGRLSPGVGKVSFLEEP